MITTSGTLTFETRGGDTFTIHPGDVILAEDTTGGGHRWRLVDDEPWRRVYVESDRRDSRLAGFSHGCSQSVAGQPSAAAMSGNAVAPSIDFAHDVGVAGVARGLGDQVQQHPPHRPRVDVVGVPRDSLRDRHVLAEVGTASTTASVSRAISS